MDTESTLASERLIVNCCRESGCAVLLVTHSIQQARRVAQQVVFLHRGERIVLEETDIVLSKPTQAEKKQFLEFYGI